MRINSRVFDERTDLLGNIKIPNCQPTELRTVAEHIMDMVTALDYTVGDYHSMTDLNKRITVDYWYRYDGLKEPFKEWYLKATDASLIERAMRWLISHNYLLPKPEVLARAQKASENFANAIKGSRL